MDRVAIVGLGLIGGSLGAALRRAGESRVVGFDAAADHLDEASARGLIDEAVADERAAVRGAGVVVVAVPVGSVADVGRRIADSIEPGAVVTDVGSTKARIVEALDAALPGRFVGGHPIAGTERSGPAAADPGLFADRIVALTRTAATGEDGLARVERLWRQAGAARVVVQSPSEHDRVFGAVSHLPHLAVFALCSALGRLGELERAALAGFGLAGFVDTTRIAGSSPRTWTDIFLANREELLRLAAGYRDRLDALCRAIESGDERVLLEEIARAAEVRRGVLGS